MKIPVRVSSVVRGFATSRALVAGAMSFAPALPVHLTAGDVSAKSAGSLNITDSIAGVVPQPSVERGWLTDFHVVGDCAPDIWHVRGTAITGEGNRLSSIRNEFGSDEYLLPVYVSGV